MVKGKGEKKAKIKERGNGREKGRIAKKKYNDDDVEYVPQVSQALRNTRELGINRRKI